MWRRPAGRADERGEPGFHVHVDVLERAVEGEGAGLDLLPHPVQALGDRVRVLLRDDPLLRQHRDVRDGARDVLGVEPAVEVDRRVDRLHHRVGRCVEAARPTCGWGRRRPPPAPAGRAGMSCGLMSGRLQRLPNQYRRAPPGTGAERRVLEWRVRERGTLRAMSDARQFMVKPDPDDGRLTRLLDGVDQEGAAIEARVVEERPLTLFLNSQEIVTVMTIRDYPAYLALGYLLNQNMLRPDDEVTGIDYDEDIETVVVRTRRATDYEATLRRKTLTSGCAQGTVFGDLHGSASRRPCWTRRRVSGPRGSTH